MAFATVTFDEQARSLPVTAIDRVIATAQAARSSSLRVALGGQAIEHAEKPSLGSATAIGLLAAIVVLLITFGSFIAMGLPIITALLGLGVGISLAGLGSHIIQIPDFATQLAAMIGLGVGIDYALFIVTRFRENRQRGATVDDAVTGAMDTAGRAVLFAGATVILALLGQLLLGVGLLERPRRRLRAGRAHHHAGGAHRVTGAPLPVRRTRRTPLATTVTRSPRRRRPRRACGCAGHTRSPDTPGAG